MVFKPPNGGVERLADSNGEIVCGEAVNGDFRTRKGEVDTDPDATTQGMLPRPVHGDATFFDSGVELRQLLGSFPDALGETRCKQVSTIHDFQRNGHHQFLTGTSIPPYISSPMPPMPGAGEAFLSGISLMIASVVRRSDATLAAF